MRYFKTKSIHQSERERLNRVRHMSIPCSIPAEWTSIRADLKHQDEWGGSAHLSPTHRGAPQGISQGVPATLHEFLQHRLRSIRRDHLPHRDQPARCSNGHRDRVYNRRCEQTDLAVSSSMAGNCIAPTLSGCPNSLVAKEESSCHRWGHPPRA
jgi:hypothetical protein